MTPVKRCLRNIWTMLPSSFVLHPFCASHSTLFKPTFETLLSCLSFPLRVDTISLFRALMSDKGIVLGRERERSVNFVRVFATLEIYFRIILLIRQNFPQEEEKNNSAFEDFDGFLFNPLNLKNLSSIIKLNFGKFIHVRGNLLEDYFHNPISFLWNVIPASWFWKISNRVTKLDSSWRISENIWWNDMYKREYGSTLSVLMHYFQIREIGTFFFFFFHSDRIVYGTRNFEERKWKNAATALTSLMFLKRRWKCVFCSYIGNRRDANKKEVENKKKSIDNEIKGKIKKRGIKDPGTKIYDIIRDIFEFKLFFNEFNFVTSGTK